MKAVPTGASLGETLDDVSGISAAVFDGRDRIQIEGVKKISAAPTLGSMDRPRAPTPAANQRTWARAASRCSVITSSSLDGQPVLACAGDGWSRSFVRDFPLASR